MTDTIQLSLARCGDRGVIVQVGDHCHHDEHAIELERRHEAASLSLRLECVIAA